MKINFNLYRINNTYPAFQSKKTENKNLVQKPIVTDTDKVYFHDYMLAKKLDLKISKKEAENLFKFNGEEFIIKTHELIGDKFGISQKIRPILSLQSLPENMMMVYAPYDHAIVINDKNMVMFYGNKHNERLAKTLFLMALRHEWQHHIQYLNLYRHEKLGNKIVMFNTQNRTNTYKDNFIDKSDFRFNLDYFNRYKQNVRKEMGIIKKGNELADSIEKSAQILLKPHTKGYINHATEEYYNDINEREARVASYTELSKFFDNRPEMQCFLKIRKYIDNVINANGIKI